MLNGWPVARCERLRWIAFLRVLGVVGVVSLGGCGPSDESQGSFNLIATGGIEIVTHGQISAYRSHDLSGLGYGIYLDVAHASPPMNGFTDLSIATEERPRGAARFIQAPALPSDARRTVWITLGEPSGANVEWLTDSGTIDFKRATGRHAVAGEFVAYMSCPRCGPDNTASRAVVRGNFETHD
jgi:hypothetical protein